MGRESIHGFEGLVTGVEESLGVSVGVLGVVPMGFRDTTSQREALSALESMDLPHSVTIRQRGASFESCRDAQCSALECVAEHRQRGRDYEQDTPGKLDQLAEFLRWYTDEEVNGTTR